jgi:hypothetical protein
MRESLMDDQIHFEKTVCCQKVMKYEAVALFSIEGEKKKKKKNSCKGHIFPNKILLQCHTGPAMSSCFRHALIHSLG